MSETIAARFESDNSDRLSNMETVYRCAAMSDPAACPRPGTSNTDRLPRSFQSLGIRGTSNMVGRLGTSLYPLDSPWCEFTVAPQIEQDPDIPNETKQEMRDRLFMRELMIVSLLESSGLTNSDNARQSAFRSQAATALNQVIVTGDTLERLGDDFRCTVFRRDQYVTRRDTCGDVLYHIIKEKKDPLNLTEEQLAKAGLRVADLEAKKSYERMEELVTLVEWQPRTKKWLIRQEVKDKEVNQYDETVPSYFSTPYKLSPSEHYGRGFIEQNLSDLESYDELMQRLLEFAETASKHLWVKNAGSTISAADLAKPTGSVLIDAVVGGQPQNIGILKASQLPDFNVVWQVAEGVRRNLASAMLIESEITPRGERVTATQVERVVQELQGALGGVYTQIAEMQQLPRLRRALHIAEKKKFFAELPRDAIEIRAVTGIGALSREMKGQRIARFVQSLAQLGPDAFGSINLDVLVDVMARYGGINEPGLVKDAKTRAAERAALQKQMAQQAMIEKGIDVAGNVIQNNATQPKLAA